MKKPFYLPGPRFENEERFLADFNKKTLVFFRRGSLLGILLYALYLPLDIFVMPEIKLESIFLRLVYVPLGVLAVYPLSYKPWFNKWQQSILFLVFSTPMTATFIFLYITQPKYQFLYFVTFMLVIIYFSLVMRFSYKWSFFGSLFYILLIVAAIMLLQVEIKTAMIVAMLFITTFGLTVFGSYFIEESFRVEFDLTKKLENARDKAQAATARAERDEQRMRSVLDTVTDAIISIDSHGVIESFNPAAQRIFGYEADGAIGRNVSILMPEPDRSGHDEQIKSFVSGQPARIMGKVVEKVAVDKDGNKFPVDISINPLYIENNTKFIGVIRNIAERKKAEEEIRRLAMTDPLTGLANRNQFLGRFEETLKLLERTGNMSALLMIDLDNFKPVNDSFGHQTGDETLKSVARALTDICRETDVVARLGGDEFAILLMFPEDEDGVRHTSERIVKRLAEPIEALGNTVQISGSIGVAMIPRDGAEIDCLISIADTALYSAKNDGRNRYKL